MATTYTWRIANLERHTADGIVFTAHYTVDASNGTYNSGAYGSVGLEQPDPENVIPYAELTEEIVVGWVKEKLGDEAVTNVEAALQSQLDEQASPTKASGLPWAN
jgi:hypothetical protein